MQISELYFWNFYLFQSYFRLLTTDGNTFCANRCVLAGCIVGDFGIDGFFRGTFGLVGFFMFFSTHASAEVGVGATLEPPCEQSPKYNVLFLLSWKRNNA